VSSVKRIIGDLAVLGGTPAFAKQLHVGSPNIGNKQRFLARVSDILDRGWLTNDGAYLREFERRLAEFVGVKHVVATCNGTIALDIAIRALELRGHVIVPSLTFIATAHSLMWQHITPIFCDVDPDTHNLDPAQVEARITSQTTGILAVHLWGRPCDVSALETIASSRGLRLIFDAAHAFGCSLNHRMIGGFGDAEVFSFHATKWFTAVEGGAIATDSDDVAATCRLMRNFGFAGYDDVQSVGTNGKMNEFSAAMGLTSFEALDGFVEHNRWNYEIYHKRLAHLNVLQQVAFDQVERCNYQYIVFELDGASGITRDQLLSVLHAENILARRYFHPGCHRMEPYRSLFPHVGDALPHTERLTDRLFSLPTGSRVQREDVETICDLVEFAVANGRQLASRMPPDAKLLPPVASATSGA
jgi:dTDP-4-amino-4,6-dideoxygalactose transaminase